MSRGRPFAVWCHAATSGRLHFSLHPLGYIPKDRTEPERSSPRCASESAPGSEGAAPPPFAVSPPLPLGFADALKSSLERDFGLPFFDSFALRSQSGRAWVLPALLRRRALRILRVRFEVEARPEEIAAVGRAGETQASRSVHSSGLLPWHEARALVEHACEILEGRALFSDELHAALRERGIQAGVPVDLLLDEAVSEGRVERVPGVRWTEKEWECSRCGSLEIGKHPCVRCGLSRCPQCDECRTLGASTACAPLYHRPLRRVEASGAFAVRPEVRVELPFDLSPKQNELADALEHLEGSAFVWAACGAGKTEVTLQAIARTLRSGGRVLFAVPRRDVADQLARRLQGAVRGAEVSLLSGETPEKYAAAPLIVATVHQALRFRGAFHLVVVDEVDAYPLNAEEWLLRGLLRAVHPRGRVIAMSATPPEAAKRKFGAGLPCFTLPARPHGFPLPVPEVWIDPGLEGAERQTRLPSADPGVAAAAASRTRVPAEGYPPWLPRLREQVRRSSAAGRRLLIFVPNVQLSMALPRLLAEAGACRLWAAGGRSRGRGAADLPAVAGVHAQDPWRREKVRAMEAGRIDVLVSTTLLERGVTLAYLDVLVFASHCERVYDSAALVQMAGRAGRKREDPFGRVVFWGARETPAMREAVAYIAALNRRAHEEGLLAGEPGGSLSPLKRS